MRDASQRLGAFRTLVRELTEDIEGADLEEVVEIGTFLAAIMTTSSKALDGIKKDLRVEAVRDLKSLPGSTAFEGIDIGGVTVAVPKAKLAWVKGVDPEVIKRSLEDDFDLFFETETKYKPRPNAGDLILRLHQGKDKMLLLSSVQEVEGTPRVSFAKV